MGLSIGAIASAMFGGDIGMNLVGSGISAYASSREARHNRAWQEQMSNTAYQRAARDLEKAGLNRVLALGSPASTPSGGQASMPDVGQSISSGISAHAAKKMAQQAENKNEAEIEALRSQAEANAATAHQATVLSGKTASEQQLIDLQALLLPAEVQARINELNSRSGTNKANARSANATADNLENTVKLTDKVADGVDAVDKIVKGSGNALADMIDSLMNPPKKFGGSPIIYRDKKGLVPDKNLPFLFREKK